MLAWGSEYPADELGPDARLDIGATKLGGRPDLRAGRAGQPATEPLVCSPDALDGAHALAFTPARLAVLTEGPSDAILLARLSLGAEGITSRRDAGTTLVNAGGGLPSPPSAECFLLSSAR